MITNFINCFFKHAITKNNLDLKYHELNFFIYITLEKYTLNKYYKIMIDIKAFKQLTAGYG